MIVQEPIASLDPRMTVRDIIAEGLIIQGIKDQKYIDEKEFAAGSMLPKIEACMSFVKDHPDREAIITSLSGLKDALAGKLGTVIVDG